MRWASQLLIPVCRQRFSKDQTHLHIPYSIFPSVFPSIFIVFFLLNTECRVFMSKFALPKKAIMALCGYVACLSLALKRNAASRDIFTCYVLITVHEEQSA